MLCNKKKFIFIILSFFCQQIFAQYDVPLYTSYTTVVQRDKLYNRLTNYSILRNLSLPLSDSTEENWEEAFDAMEVLDYKTPFTKAKVYIAFDSIERRSIPFQRALLELAYTNYPGEFLLQAQALLDKTLAPKIFAMCAEYLVQQKKDLQLENKISKTLFAKFDDSIISVNPILKMLQARLESPKSNPAYPVKKVLKEILTKDFLPNQIVMYSFQRKNRDYPGLVLIRNADGDFITDSSGNIFNIPQLARSITNLPGYLTNGNTPQGIFRMYGFGVSMSSFIGPTANVQLGMPAEISIKKFFDDTTIPDSTWTIDRYQKLIPYKIRDYQPLYYSYYSGLAGRSDIIAHGTTIDPKFYVGKPYYPLTPTEGCLCTKEIWDGKRLESDQQKLVNALLRAGGANGYCVVIELDDKQSAVTLKDILPFIMGK
ncbi:MAG: hypothetical protein Q8891_03910 [Bacteroidota bacterium]|nr:hypothetical protein [Bacteroidota bacterium]